MNVLEWITVDETLNAPGADGRTFSPPHAFLELERAGLSEVVSAALGDADSPIDPAKVDEVRNWLFVQPGCFVEPDLNLAIVG